MPEFFAELMASSADFHFLRPLWFLGLIPAALVLALFQWRKRSAGNWAQIINPALLPFLMQGEDRQKAPQYRLVNHRLGPRLATELHQPCGPYLAAATTASAQRRFSVDSGIRFITFHARPRY